MKLAFKPALIISPMGGGKTTLMLYLIKAKGLIGDMYHQIVVFSNQAGGLAYQFLLEGSNSKRNRVTNLDLEYVDQLINRNMKAYKEGKPLIRTAIIFDDALLKTEKNCLISGIPIN